jgi:hypothetical protein
MISVMMVLFIKTPIFKVTYDKNYGLLLSAVAMRHGGCWWYIRLCSVHVMLILRTVTVFLLFLCYGFPPHTLLFVFLALGIGVIGIYKIFNRLSKV